MDLGFGVFFPSKGDEQQGKSDETWGFHGSFFMSVGSKLGGNAPCHSDGEDYDQ